jgi:hypothetical protein
VKIVRLRVIGDVEVLFTNSVSFDNYERWMMMEQNRIATFSPSATATKANLRASCGLCTSPGRLWCTFSWPWGDKDEQKLSAREALLEQIARLTDNQVSTDEAEPEKTMLGPEM